MNPENFGEKNEIYPIIVQAQTSSGEIVHLGVGNIIAPDKNHQRDIIAPNRLVIRLRTPDKEIVIEMDAENLKKHNRSCSLVLKKAKSARSRQNQKKKTYPIG